MNHKLKRILALLGALLLLAMYLITLVLAFIDPTQAKDWFRVSVGCTVIIPIFLYACILVYRLLKRDK